MSECSLSLASVLVQMNVCEHVTTQAHRQLAGCCSAPCMCPPHDTLIGTHRQAHNTLDVLSCRIHFQLAALVGACGLIQVALPLRATRHTRQLAVRNGAAARTHCMPLAHAENTHLHRRLLGIAAAHGDTWITTRRKCARTCQRACLRSCCGVRQPGVGCGLLCMFSYEEYAPRSIVGRRSLHPVNVTAVVFSKRNLLEYVPTATNQQQYMQGAINHDMPAPSHQQSVFFVTQHNSNSYWPPAPGCARCDRACALHTAFRAEPATSCLRSPGALSRRSTLMVAYCLQRRIHHRVPGRIIAAVAAAAPLNRLGARSRRLQPCTRPLAAAARPPLIKALLARAAAILAVL